MELLFVFSLLVFIFSDQREDQQLPVVGLFDLLVRGSFPSSSFPTEYSDYGRTRSSRISCVALLRLFHSLHHSPEFILATNRLQYTQQTKLQKKHNVNRIRAMVRGAKGL
jgi:hypothetical protein